MFQGSLLLSAIMETGTKQLIRVNCLLRNLTRSEQYFEALQLFHQVHSSHNLRPDHYTLSLAITACANLRDAATGTQLQASAICSGLNFFPHVRNTLLLLYWKSQDLNSVKRVFSEIQDPDVYSWTTLLSACTKLGDVGYACHMFDLMHNRDVAVWNAIITGCGKSGYDEIALTLFRKMIYFGVGYDNYSLASVLSLCSFDLLDFGKQVHSLIVKTGFLARTSVVNALLTMYFDCKRMEDGYRVFREEGTIVQDQITYNAMINGLVSMERNEDTYFMFKTMLNVGLTPTDLSFVSTMSSCSCERIAIQIHALAVKLGFEVYTSVSNATIKMYSNCDNLFAAHLVFQGLEEKDVVSWNTMIMSYSRENRGKEAILVYLQMQREGIRPDLFTIGSFLVSSELLVVETIQASVIKSALILETEVSNALLSAFSRHGHIRQAYQIFHEMNSKNLISWNTLINGHQLNGYPMQGLELFSQLVSSGLFPNVYTLSIVLSICASISSLQYGEQVHACILKRGYYFETSLSNALITLYAKCGLLDSSLRIFQNVIEKDVVTWNSMISAYAQHGQGREAILYFEMMQNSGVEPDKATFTAVLSACSHSGLLSDGTRIFNSLVNAYGIKPEEDHFSCIVDLLGRAGYLDEVESLLMDKFIDIDSSVWWTLFSSCAAHGNLRLGRIVAGILLEAEKHNPAVYVNLSNICANVGNWEESAYVRELMKKRVLMKQPGSSWIGS
ncbi:hypothetical protein M9H77_30445 [Catharanthus roseus]|uniref:Uncharacterized protein n=1 Tax=Catharanthus roseus TaxID=4058 RepID=A0ACC0A1J2_CATRO|nr:hypothetical protein M9H77_30445 [Catharanthus roseus]